MQNSHLLREKHRRRSSRMLGEANKMISEEKTFKFFFTVSEMVTCKECFDLDGAMQGNTTNLYNHLKHPHKAFGQSYKRLTQALKC